MDIKTLESFKLSDAIVFHDQLNPKLFVNNHIREDVKKQLLVIAEDFLSELGINNLYVVDVTVSGSNAAYSYTPHSDLDLHVLVDLRKTNQDEIYKELFDAKKTLYNDSHDIKIHGVPVELYVQDSNQPVISLGEYSLLKDKWLRIPTKRRANFDQNSTKSKYEQLKKLIDLALKSKNIKTVTRILKKIKRYRQAGLDKGGEFGPENLAYKALRSQGYITKLYELRDKLHSEILTIETMYQNPEHIQEAVTDNYLYHATQPAGMMRILRTGAINASYRPQEATKTRTQYPTISTTRSKQYAESEDFVDFLNLTRDGNAVIIVFDRNSVANHYKMFSTSQGTQTVGDEYEEVIVVPKGAMPIRGTMKGFYFNPRRTKEIEEYQNTPWFKELLNSPYYMGPKQGVGEDYDPNGPPPGPETKPTMPKGTVKVDVSDVYDWYKLGQHISNMKGLGKHDFGKGPPSTILSFGDEDIEHQYIKDLEKTGLTTTDIDPKAHDVKKGQKTDPTYNVNEASGYIPSEKEKNDPRFKTALTVDVKPDSIKKNAKAFYWKTSRAGIPPDARPDGKF